MSFQFRDYRLAPLENAGSVITFNSQIIPALPNGETLTYARAGVNVIAGPSSAGNAWIYRGAWAKLNLNPVGGWGVVIDDEYVAWQEQNSGVWRASLDGVELMHLPIPWQATGLLDMVNGVVRSDDRSQPFSVTWGGVTYLCQLWMTRSGRTVMQANNMPGGSGVVVWDANTSQLWRVYSGDYQVPPRISEDGKTVALTGDMASGFVPDSAWTLEPTAPALPDITRIKQKKQPIEFGVFVKGQISTLGNCWIDEAVGGSRLVGPMGQVWMVYDAEQGNGPTDAATPKCIFGPADKLLAISFTPTPYDLMFVYCVPQPNESRDAMFDRFAVDVNSVAEKYQQNVPMGVVCFIRTNNVLSEVDIANGIEICSLYPSPVLIFRAYGPDVPQSAIDRVIYWRNGQFCPPQVLPPSDSTAAVKLLMET